MKLKVGSVYSIKLTHETCSEELKEKFKNSRVLVKVEALSNEGLGEEDYIANCSWVEIPDDIKVVYDIVDEDDEKEGIRFCVSYFSWELQRRDMKNK